MTRRHRASLPLWCGVILLLSVPPSWGQQELRSGKKGATDPAPVTSTSIDANTQGLDVNVVGGSLGNVTIENTDGAIVDGANNAIKATVLDLTNSNPVTVGIVDSNGDQITSFGGGTQYQQGTAATTTDTMTMAGCVRVDTPAVAAGVIDGDRARCIVDSTGRLWVHVGVIDGTVAATQSGTWNIGSLTSITNPVAVTGTFWQATQPVSGTVTANAGTGNFTVVQPTGTNLHIVCDSGCSSSSGFLDNGAFTFGTTSINPIGGVLDDTSTNVATENSAAVARITAQKALHMNLRNNSGTEIGTSGAPVRTDPTGTTTQPVSGTVTANIGTSGSLALDATLTGGTQKAIVRGGAKGTTSATDVTSTASGANHQPLDVVIYDTSGNAITSFGGSGGTSSSFGSAFPTPGTAAGFTDGTNMVAGRVVTSAPSTSDAGLVVRPISPASSTVGSAVPSVGVQVTGTDGTNARAIKTDTNGELQVDVLTMPTVSITANSSVNMAQVNGSTAQVATNGMNTTGAGLQSTSLAAQCDDTTPTALTENQFGNVRMNCTDHSLKIDHQSIAGNTVATGNGVSGTGVQRVTIASDSTGTVAVTQATAANLNMRSDTSGATGAAPPARASYAGGLSSGATGGLLGGFTVCDSYANINVATATTTLLVTGVSGRHVRICGLNMVTAAANNVALISGTGATCGTGTTGMNGGTTAASGWNFAANGGLTQGNGLGTINQTNATGDSVCIVTSAATQLSGRISYAIY